MVSASGVVCSGTMTSTGNVNPADWAAKKAAAVSVFADTLAAHCASALSMSPGSISSTGNVNAEDWAASSAAVFAGTIAAVDSVSVDAIAAHCASALTVPRFSSHERASLGVMRQRSPRPGYVPLQHMHRGCKFHCRFPRNGRAG
eukprot:scaffold13455_cov57-Phaeocystis_antarctica.AAC.2